MRPRYTQRGDQHGDAAQKEDRSAEGKESSQKDDPMLVDDQHKDPDGEEDSARDLAHVEGPRDVRDIVQEDVRKRGIALHIRHTLVHHHHNKGCYPRDQERVRCEYR